MNIGYIYLITNKINGKKYVGQTVTSIEERFYRHYIHSKDPKRAIGIDGAIKKYGIENFKCELIKECPIEELDKWEIFYIKEYNTYQGNNEDNGYNLTLGGRGSLLYEIDEEEMLEMYLKGKTTKDLSQYYGCSEKTISSRLKKYNVDSKKHQQEWLKQHPQIWENNLKQGQIFGKKFQKGDGVKPVHIIELDLTFDSLKSCSQWLIDNNFTQAKDWELVRKSLSRHLNGERKSYLKMHFEFV